MSADPVNEAVREKVARAIQKEIPYTVDATCLRAADAAIAVIEAERARNPVSALNARGVDAAVKVYQPPGVTVETHRANMERAIGAYIASFPIAARSSGSAAQNHEDDEWQYTEEKVTPEQVEAAAAMARGCGVMRRRPARSPQDEDHEAGENAERPTE